jgi:hypothetical protein
MRIAMGFVEGLHFHAMFSVESQSLLCFLAQRRMRRHSGLRYLSCNDYPPRVVGRAGREQELCIRLHLNGKRQFDIGDGSDESGSTFSAAG